MSLYWCSCGRNGLNFGDHIGPYLYEKMTGQKAHKVKNGRTTVHHLVAGSILAKATHRSIVWGAGILVASQRFPKPQAVTCVRGPLTRQRFLAQKYDCPECYGDPGLLLPRFYTSPQKVEFEMGLIPHYVDYKACCAWFKDRPEVRIIDVCQPIETVIDAICECKTLLSSSLHGIIVSHAYQKPCVWVQISNKILGKNTKYRDYYLSFKDPKLTTLKPKWLSADVSIETLKTWTQTYPNPTFPIPTQKLLDSCPFLDKSL